MSVFPYDQNCIHHPTIASCTPYVSSAESNTVNREPINKQEVGVLEAFATDYEFKINSDLTED